MMDIQYSQDISNTTLYFGNQGSDTYVIDHARINVASFSVNNLEYASMLFMPVVYTGALISVGSIVNSSE